jgi:predicted PhzF superfamily epimerase YddE/YHI9
MTMRARLFRVVTFSTDPGRGNPAFVLTDADGAGDHTLTAACAMLGADIIAVADAEAGGDVPLKFFTQAGPHPGAGHATLAAAHVVLLGGFEERNNKGSCLFRQVNGEVRPAWMDGPRIAVDFPVMPGVSVDRTGELAAALGAKPDEALIAPFGYVAVFEDAALVAALSPDFALLSAFDRNAVIATAPGADDCDIVIRVFAPKVGLPEDPVCGTAHRIVVPYWAARLGKRTIHSRQLSARGGDLWCEDRGELVAIAGQTCLVLDGEVRLP